MAETVFVTGGSGYLGRNMIKYLVSKGHSVRAIARSAASAAAVRTAGAEAIPDTDLSDEGKLTKAAEGCGWAVHCAANVTQWEKDWTGVRRDNVQGTVNVVIACQKAGVRKVVLISTENTILAGKPLVNVDETYPYPKSSYGPYSTTKREAEQAALPLSSPQCEVVVVRPRLIWGGDDTTILPPLAAAVGTGDLKWFSGGTYLTSTVHVTNCCHGTLCALERGKGGEIYFLTDGAPVEWKTFATQMLTAGGVEGIDRIKSIPLSVVWAGAAILEGLACITGRPPLVTRGVLATLGLEVTVNDAKARRELGYENVVSVEEGMADLRARYVDQGKSVLDSPGS